MRHTRLGLLMPLFVLLPLLSACGSSNSGNATATSTPLPLATVPKSSAFSVALVTDVGGLHDRSLNELTWKGLQMAQKDYLVVIRSKESRSETDYLPNLRYMAQHYMTLIVAVGYSMARAVFDAAGQFPQQRFAIVDARPVDAANHVHNLPNVENILFREQDSGYLAGVAAALFAKSRTKTRKSTSPHNTIGYLGGSAIPQVTHYLAGYVAGAKRVDPTVKIVGDFSHSFVSPTAGQSIARAQIAKGATVLFQVAGQTGSGYLQAAKRAGVVGVGSDTDESFLGSFILTSALKRVDSIMPQVVNAARAGHFPHGDTVFGAVDGGAGIARLSRAFPTRLLHEVRSYQQKLVRGEIVPPSTLSGH